MVHWGGVQLVSAMHLAQGRVHLQEQHVPVHVQQGQGVYAVQVAPL